MEVDLDRAALSQLSGSKRAAGRKAQGLRGRERGYAEGIDLETLFPRQTRPVAIRSEWIRRRALS